MTTYPSPWVCALATFSLATATLAGGNPQPVAISAVAAVCPAHNSIVTQFPLSVCDSFHHSDRHYKNRAIKEGNSTHRQVLHKANRDVICTHTAAKPALPALANDRSPTSLMAGEFILTAYSLDAHSTGKSPSMPGFGITASGVKATLNRTVAVDPTLIPFGTALYIEGVGWRIAEDSGGAVKGRHIDVLLPSQELAYSFGVHRHVHVYARSAALAGTATTLAGARPGGRSRYETGAR